MYDAFCVLGFGGPEKPEDVLPFLRNVTAGRNVPDSRLATVARQYERFGGRSPLNDQNRALIHALKPEFEEHGIRLPIYFGNRNWDPYLSATVEQMAADGIRNALVFVTSAFSSYSGCRQYREDMAAARATAGEGAPDLHKIRLFYNHPGFLDAVEAQIRTVHLPGSRLIFTAHSIPESMASWCDYETQLQEMAGLLAARLNERWDLAYQSRSGPPHIPWLGPDINDHLKSLSDAGTGQVTVVPLGFISDHMEVQYDLDHQAAETAASLGIDFRRAPTVGTHPFFIAAIRQLVQERLDNAPALWVGTAGPWPDPCPQGHCLPPS
ncbi:MAG: ferrochelatase [Acidimicrobiales bacterium]|nr:ferrochelatase [Acidimicrobiales bacterium]